MFPSQGHSVFSGGKQTQIFFPSDIGKILNLLRTQDIFFFIVFTFLVFIIFEVPRICMMF